LVAKESLLYLYFVFVCFCCAQFGFLVFRFFVNMCGFCCCSSRLLLFFFRCSFFVFFRFCHALHSYFFARTLVLVAVVVVWGHVMCWRSLSLTRALLAQLSHSTIIKKNCDFHVSGSLKLLQITLYAL